MRKKTLLYFCVMKQWAKQRSFSFIKFTSFKLLKNTWTQSIIIGLYCIQILFQFASPCQFFDTLQWFSPSPSLPTLIISFQTYSFSPHNCTLPASIVIPSPLCFALSAQEYDPYSLSFTWNLLFGFSLSVFLSLSSYSPSHSSSFSI